MTPPLKPSPATATYGKAAHRVVFCAALLLIAMPPAAHANAGTPLMWAGILHLLFGNLFVGLMEGIILARAFRISPTRCVALMIPANYISAWIGYLLISGAVGRSLGIDLHNAWTVLWTLVAVAYALTLILEYPFVAWAFRGDAHWRRKSIGGSLIIQTVSYALLFGWYSMATVKPFYVHTGIVDLAALSPHEEIVLYYISSDDGDVYSRRLVKAPPRHVFDLKSANAHARLFARRSSVDTNAWDLVAHLEGDDRADPVQITVRNAFANVSESSRFDSKGEPVQDEDRHYFFGEVPRLGEARSSSWKFQCGFFAAEGLSGTNTDTGARVELAFETPFLSWEVRNATHLPGDQVLFRLGDDQICLYDPAGDRIALVTRGRSPIAVIDREADASDDAGVLP